MVRVAVPQIFENMEEATIGRWLVAEGQTVSVEQPLCELITEKTTLELPSTVAGIVRRLVVGEKAVVPSHYIIAVLSEVGAEVSDAQLHDELSEVDAANAALREMPSVVAPPAPKVEVPASIPVPSVPAPSGGGRLRATPAARRAAKDLGVSLEVVAEAYPGKVVGEDDVKEFAAK